MSVRLPAMIDRMEADHWFSPDNGPPIHAYLYLGTDTAWKRGSECVPHTPVQALSALRPGLDYGLRVHPLCRPVRLFPVWYKSCPVTGTWHEKAIV